MKECCLMHRNDPIALVVFDDVFERIEGVKVIDSTLKNGPFLGNTTLENLQMWWKTRAIPGSRAQLKAILEENHCLTAGEYMAKHFALSLTDAFWIRPLETCGLTWSDVNLFTHMDGEKLELYGRSFFQSNSCLNGQMNKNWKRIPDPVDPSKIRNYLVKKSELSEGQQNVNEAFAALVHQKQGLRKDIDYVDYDLYTEEGVTTASRCLAFTSEHRELVYAMELVYAGKRRNEESMFDTVVRVASENGLDEDLVRTRLEYMLATDFILSNQDRHLLNFGFLRDPDSLLLVGPAPLYDTGNSMHWDSIGLKQRYSLLNEETNGFVSRSANLLKNVSNRSIVDLEKLPTKQETEEFYQYFGISETRAAIIAENYARKVDLYYEFQQGQTFNLYKEKVQRRTAEQEKKRDFEQEL